MKTPLKLLIEYFGYDAFRPMQEEIIYHILSGNDTIVLMPTGGGKSLCYQIPALAKEGLSLVISPLIALMKDQVQSLNANGVPAAFLNSSLSRNDEMEIFHALGKGSLKLLYVSPEKLFSDGFVGHLKKWNLSLIAIDEAHCVSSWGHHFRPEYKSLGRLKELFPQVPLVALTATADKAVRSEIGSILKMKNPKMFLGSFDRPNLSLNVLPGQKKWEQMLKMLERFPRQNGIIYFNSRKATEDIASKLQSIGRKVSAYHAGLDSGERDRIQEDFIQGKISIICATVAFGMGIDKSDIRFVIHYNMPANIEGFYQEIGRAGRDGLEAETLLFYSYRDVMTQMHFIEQIDNPDYKKIQISKLERIKEYAESQVCRRKILMTYFSEFPEDDCGNCDVCQNPPEYFDGTVYAQMAISAVIRAKEKIGPGTLNDVLRGVYSPQVKERALDQIKTFGAGRQLNKFIWTLYIQQLIQLGLLEMDYKDSYSLKITPLSKEVIFENGQVKLVTADTIKQRQEKKVEIKKKVPKTLDREEDEALFIELKALRNEIAEKIRKPAYVIFSNQSLVDMAMIKPTSMDEFLTVHGVGEFKASKYGEPFMNRVQEFLQRL